MHRSELCLWLVHNPMLTLIAVKWSIKFHNCVSIMVYNYTHQLLSSWTWLWVQCPPAGCLGADCLAGWNIGCCCRGYWGIPAVWALCSSGSFWLLSGECSCSRLHLVDTGQKHVIIILAGIISQLPLSCSNTVLLKALWKVNRMCALCLRQSSTARAATENKLSNIQFCKAMQLLLNISLFYTYTCSIQPRR